MLLIGRLLPLRLQRAIGGLLGLLLYWTHAAQRHTTCDNLLRCLPQMPEAERRVLTRNILMHAGMALVESLWVWGQSSDSLVSRVPVEGGELLERARRQNKGIVLLSTHGANPDLASRWAAGALPEVYTTYSTPRTSKAMTRLLPRLRHQNSRLQLLPTDRGAAALRKLYRALRSGGAAMTWTDMDPVHGTGHYAPLFGRPAHTPVLPYRLAHLPDVIPLWCWCSRTPGGFKIHFKTPNKDITDDDPARAIAALNGDLQQIILALNEQYFYWTYKRFRHQPPNQPKVQAKP